MATRYLSVRAGLMVSTLSAVACLSVCMAGCLKSDAGWGDGPTPRVLVSFSPLKCFAMNVVGDDATVKSILSNEGPHHFDPKQSDQNLVASADVFFINGLGLDDRAAEKMLRASGNTELRLIKLGDMLDPKLKLEAEHDHDHDHAGHNHGHSHDSPNDPHAWLGIDQAVSMVQSIRDELKVRDPNDGPKHDKRAEEYVEKLKKLKADGVAAFAGKTERKFVTFHESLRYFANTFGLEIAGVIQKTPGTETTAKELDAIVKACLDQKVRVIAVEPQYSPQSAKRIKEELELKGVKDVTLVEIDPLETAAEADLTPDWYEKRMRANVEALSKALR